jgi:hypothetical protein
MMLLGFVGFGYMGYRASRGPAASLVWFWSDRGGTQVLGSLGPAWIVRNSQ